MLCRFVIAFPARSKCILISWLQPMSAVIFQPMCLEHCTWSGSAGQKATCALVGQGPGHPGRQGRDRHAWILSLCLTPAS